MIITDFKKFFKTFFDFFRQSVKILQSNFRHGFATRLLQSAQPLFLWCVRRNFFQFRNEEESTVSPANFFLCTYYYYMQKG